MSTYYMSVIGKVIRVGVFNVDDGFGGKTSQAIVELTNQRNNEVVNLISSPHYGQQVASFVKAGHVYSFTCLPLDPSSGYSGLITHMVFVR